MLVKVNLLDWRSGRREKNKQDFFRMLALFGICAALIVGFAYLVMGQKISAQNSRNTMLKTEIAKIDKQIIEIQDLESTKANLLSRMTVIEQLQQSRSASVHFFDEIVNTLPEGIYITAIKQTGDTVNIDGVADSNGDVAVYLQNLDSSPWFNDPSLVVIKTEDPAKTPGYSPNAANGKRNIFTIKVNTLTASADKNQPTLDSSGVSSHPEDQHNKAPIGKTTSDGTMTSITPDDKTKSQTPAPSANNKIVVVPNNQPTIQKAPPQNTPSQISSQVPGQQNNSQPSNPSQPANSASPTNTTNTTVSGSSAITNKNKIVQLPTPVSGLNPPQNPNNNKGNIQ